MIVYKDKDLTISLLERKVNVRVTYKYKNKSNRNCYRSLIEAKLEINKILKDYKLNNKLNVNLIYS